VNRLDAKPATASALKRHTDARVALGRCGSGLPTAAMLDFQAAHARARDAVHQPLDVAGLLAQLGGPSAAISVASRAADRAAYLRNPGLGRRLAETDAAKLVPGDYDVAFVIADGLSATATHRHAAPLLMQALPRLSDWRVAPVVVARLGRVALGDEIGERLGARLVVILLGERPGLSACDSLGAYLTWSPRVGCLDSDRNCISNIRPGGQSYDEAAGRLLWLMRQARRRAETGVRLKDQFSPVPALA